MNEWVEMREYCKLTGFEEDRVLSMIRDGYLNSKNEEGVIYIDVASGTSAIIKKGDSFVVENSEESEDSQNIYNTAFVEKTIGTILSLHEKVLESKDETLNSLRSENQFLKDALYSMQDVYDQDKKSIDTLSEQLKIAQEELNFMKRKYKLMWGKIGDLNSTK